MNNNELIKVTAKNASIVCQQLELEEVAKQLLNPELTPSQYLQLLIEQKQFPDAIRFLAMALPHREAVWWACVSARASVTEKTKPQMIAALTAAEAWVYQPTEENRRSAMALAEATEFSGACSWAAVAAFWSGGSISPPDAPAVPPPEGLTAKAVAGAVMLAAGEINPEAVDENYKIGEAKVMPINNSSQIQAIDGALRYKSFKSENIFRGEV